MMVGRVCALLALGGCVWWIEDKGGADSGDEATGRDTSPDDSEGGGDTNHSGDSGARGGLELSSSEVDFGDVALSLGASAALTLSNTAEEDINVVGFTSSDPAFAATADFRVPGVLFVGASQTLTITFAPSEEINYAGTIAIETGPTSYATSIDVSGRGVSSCTICQPVLAVDTGGSDAYALSFTLFTTIDGFSQTLPLTLSNPGDEDLVVTALVLTNDTVSTCGVFFTDWSGAAMTIPPEGSDLVEVTWVVDDACIDAPNEALDFNYLHILSNDPDQPDYAIALSAVAL